MGSDATCHGGPRSGIWTRRAAGGRRSRPRSASSTSRASHRCRNGWRAEGASARRSSPSSSTGSSGGCSALAYERGGGLLKFGGDALLLMFASPDHAAQAASAAVDLRTALREAAAVPTSVGRVALRMSVGIHSGTIHLFRVGQSHHELLIAGPAATATTQMEHAAGPGQIVVSPSTRAALPPQAVDESGGPGLVLRWRQPKAAPLAPVPLRPVPKEVVARYLPPALRTHLVERSREPEHRAATIAFLRFSGVDALDGRRGTRRRGRGARRGHHRGAGRGRRPTRSPSSPPTSTRTAARWCWPPGCRPPGPTTRGGWSAASAGSPTAACRSRSRWGSTGATSSSARSAWPTARRSRSWATP